MTAPDDAVVSLHVYLAYRDAAAALAWLERALGFTTTMRWTDEQGRVAHAELRRGPAAIVVFDDAGAGYDRLVPRGPTVGQGVYLAMTDAAAVDAVWTRAVDAGAELVWRPEWTRWGNYPARVRDPWGVEWTFALHVPGRVTAFGGEVPAG